jgi:hypothetical protein
MVIQLCFLREIKVLNYVYNLCLCCMKRVGPDKISSFVELGGAWRSK